MTSLHDREEATALARLLLERFPSWYGGNAQAATNPRELVQQMAQRDAEWLIEHAVRASSSTGPEGEVPSKGGGPSSPMTKRGERFPAGVMSHAKQDWATLDETRSSATADSAPGSSTGAAPDALLNKLDLIAYELVVADVEIKSGRERARWDELQRITPAIIWLRELREEIAALRVQPFEGAAPTCELPHDWSETVGPPGSSYRRCRRCGQTGIPKQGPWAGPGAID